MGNAERNGWSKEEDLLLINAVERHGQNDWKAVASQVPNRTNKACRKVFLLVVYFVAHHRSVGSIRSAQM